MIDPVRFISNFSTGKMSVALADEAVKRGAKVTLILGPSSCKPKNAEIEIVNVVSASEMASQTISRFPKADIAILSAAVSDFTPKERNKSKIKRGKDDLFIELTPTTDIAATLGEIKTKRQLLVGFALETDNEEKSAISKISRKNLDMIVLNSLQDSGAGFGFDTNKITIIDSSNNIDKFELKSKEEVASDIFNKIEGLL